MSILKEYRFETSRIKDAKKEALRKCKHTTDYVVVEYLRGTTGYQVVLYKSLEELRNPFNHARVNTYHNGEMITMHPERETK
jgi:hypothetical protein